MRPRPCDAAMLLVGTTAASSLPVFFSPAPPPTPPGIAPRPEASAARLPPAPEFIKAVDHAAIFASGVAPAKSSHYAMLGVPKSAGDAEIKKAYNKLAMKWHPDKNPSDTARAEVVFMGIKDAYECLSDPIKKRRYDRLGV